MANEDAANRATEYWLSLASAGGGGADNQTELFEIKQAASQDGSDAETLAPRRSARNSAG